MKLTVFLLLLTNACLAQIENYTPPGTVYIKDNFFVDLTEIANIHWLEYEFYISQDSTIKFYQSNIPDSTLTMKYRPNYYQSSAFRYFPVIGITHSQATNYCSWRSDVINIKLRKEYEEGIRNVLLNVNFRLPSEVEWEEVARLSDTLSFVKPREYKIERPLKSNNMKYLLELYPENSKSLKEIKKEIKMHKLNDTIPNYKLDFIRPWFATIEDQLPEIVYYPYQKREDIKEPANMLGNVAELVAETGFVKGGSWRHQLAVSFPYQRILIHANKPYDWVGFRCIWELSIVKRD